MNEHTRRVSLFCVEFGQNSDLPQNAEELFNLRHSARRAKVECTIGLLKVVRVDRTVDRTVLL